MTSTQIALAAARAPAMSPLAAFLQILSTLTLRLAGRVAALRSTDSHAATACCTAAPFAPATLGAGVELVVEGVELGAVVEVVAAGLEVLLLVVEPPPPPQPATSAPPASAKMSQVSGLRIIGHPWIAGRLAHDARALRQPSDLQAYIARSSAHSRLDELPRAWPLVGSSARRGSEIAASPSAGSL
jgi:hypothetical protein